MKTLSGFSGRGIPAMALLLIVLFLSSCGTPYRVDRREDRREDRRDIRYDRRDNRYDRRSDYLDYD